VPPQPLLGAPQVAPRPAQVCGEQVVQRYDELQVAPPEQEPQLRVPPQPLGLEPQSPVWHVIGVQSPPPPPMWLSMLEKLTRLEVFWAMSYLSQLMDQVITPRKPDWLVPIVSVPQLVLAVMQSYALLISVVENSGPPDDSGPEGMPKASLLAGSPAKAGPPLGWNPFTSILIEATRLSIFPVVVVRLYVP
jgi:hypothetical protein